MKTNEVVLCGDELLSLPGGDAAARLYCTAGTLWVTVEGDPEDHLVAAGAAFPLHRRGKVVVQALGCARAEIVAATRAAS